MIVERQMKTSYLNVGCGSRFYRGEPWVNLDVAPVDASVMRWDVSAGFPMEADTFDVVYLSQVLEHFPEKDGSRLAAECYRVLKPGGILRVVVPDLEGICREYLRNLDEIRTKPPGHPDRLAWIKLELLDQCIRHESGGCMRTFFRDHDRDELDYVVGRIGTVGLQLAKACSPSAVDGKTRRPARSRFGGWNWESLRMSLLNALLNQEEAEALHIGQFRMRGEVHLWMYESVTLEQLFKCTGFVAVAFHYAETLTDRRLADAIILTGIRMAGNMLRTLVCRRQEAAVMNLLHLSYADIARGAAQATYQLHTLLRESGHRSVLAVRRKDSSDLDVVQVGARSLRTCSWPERIERARVPLVRRLSGNTPPSPLLQSKSCACTQSGRCIKSHAASRCNFFTLDYQAADSGRHSQTGRSISMPHYLGSNGYGTHDRRVPLSRSLHPLPFRVQKLSTVKQSGGSRLGLDALGTKNTASF